MLLWIEIVQTVSSISNLFCSRVKQGRNWIVYEWLYCYSLSAAIRSRLTNFLSSIDMLTTNWIEEKIYSLEYFWKQLAKVWEKNYSSINSCLEKSFNSASFYDKVFSLFFPCLIGHLEKGGVTVAYPIMVACLGLEDILEIGEAVLVRWSISWICTATFLLLCKEVDPQLAMDHSGRRFGDYPSLWSGGRRFDFRKNQLQ